MISKDDFGVYVHMFIKDFYEKNPARKLNHTFIALAPIGDVVCTQVSWSNPEEKAEILEDLHEKYKELGITMYAYAGECWGSFQMSVKPSDAPDRFEMVSVLVHAKEDGRILTKGHVYKINRDDHSHIDRLEPLPGSMQGLELSLLLHENPRFGRGGNIDGIIDMSS